MNNTILIATLVLTLAATVSAATPPTQEGFLASVKFTVMATPPVTFTPHSTGECEVVRKAMDRGYELNRERPLALTEAANLVCQSMAIVKAFRPEQHSGKCQANTLAMVQNVRAIVDSIGRENPRPKELNARLGMWMKAYCRQWELEDLEPHPRAGFPEDRYHTEMLRLRREAAFCQEYRNEVLGLVSRLFNEAPLPPNMEGTDNPNGWWHKGYVPWDAKWFTPPVFRSARF